MDSATTLLLAAAEPGAGSGATGDIDWKAVTLLVVIGLVVVFWVVQFAQLMTLGDDFFPGRHDKILWVVAFVTLSALAPFAFLWWKTIIVAVRKVEREKPQQGQT